MMIVHCAQSILKTNLGLPKNYQKMHMLQMICHNAPCPFQRQQRFLIIPGQQYLFLETRLLIILCIVLFWRIKKTKKP